MTEDEPTALDNILLGGQISLGVCLFVAGLYMVISTFEHSRQLSSVSGEFRIGLGVVCMGAGLVMTGLGLAAI